MLVPDPDPAEELRRAVFAFLVATQDRVRHPHEAKQRVLSHYGITWNQLEKIELEGIDQEWPPLDE